MIKPENQKEIIDILQEEAERIKFGKIVIEVSISNKNITNIQFETKRSIVLAPQLK